MYGMQLEVTGVTRGSGKDGGVGLPALLPAPAPPQQYSRWEEVRIEKASRCGLHTQSQFSKEEKANYF